MLRHVTSMTLEFISRLAACSVMGGSSLLLIPQVANAQAVSLSPTFYGESIALQVRVTGETPVTLVDSGPAPQTGGLTQNSLWDPTSYGVDGRGFYAMSDGVQGANHSSSSITEINLPVMEHRIVAQFIKADAYANSQFLGVATSGTTVIGRLTLDGQNISATGAANQRINFSNGYLIINEQRTTGDGKISGSITINALHLVVYGMADAIVC